MTALSAGSLGAQQRNTDRYVGSVRFKGNDALESVILASSIATTSSGWIYRTFHGFGDRQVFDETEFRRDVVRLQLLYRQHGFYEAHIDTAVNRGGKLISPTFIIREGPPIIVDSVAVTGVDSVANGAALAIGLPLAKGARFDRVDFDAAGDSIAYAVRDRGYPYSTVFRNFTVNRLTRRAVVQYDVLPGPHAVIGDIAITGVQRIGEPTVRRTITIRPGDEYRATALLNSQRALYQSELFRYANVGIATPDSTVNGQDSLVRVRVQVAEAGRVRARAGLGYGTIDCLRGSATITVLNFLGQARRLDLVTRVSKIGVGDPTHWSLENTICGALKADEFSTSVNYLGSASLSQPVGLVRGAIASVQIFKERRSEYRVYLVTSTGGALGLKFGVGRNRGVPLSLNYRLSNELIRADTAQYCVYFNQCDPATIAQFSQSHRQGALTATLVSSRVDSPVEPTSGQTLTIEATSAERFLASQVVFRRLVVEGVAYRPMPHRRVVSARLRAGIIGAGKFAGTGARYVPPSEAFYAGGPTTVRGFGRNEMGQVVYVYSSPVPADHATVALRSSPIGSVAEVIANIEVRTPTPLLDGRLGFSVFVDGGELWSYGSSGTDYVGQGFKITPGIGFQVATPLGPMRLTAAYNRYGRPSGPIYRIDPTTNTLVSEGTFPGTGQGGSFLRHIQLHFSVGLAF